MGGSGGEEGEVIVMKWVGGWVGGCSWMEGGGGVTTCRALMELRGFCWVVSVCTYCVLVAGVIF